MKRSLAQLARLQVAGARARSAAAREMKYRKQLKALRVEILSNAPTNGDELTGLLEVADKAFRAFVAAAAAHDAMVVGWRQRLDEMGVPALGVPSAEHEGLGSEFIGSVIVDDLRIPTADAGHILRMCFVQDEVGRLIPVPEGDRTGFDVLARIGRAI